MQEINYEKVGQFISQQRKLKGWTQKELGERLYVTDKTVSKWERGLSMPNVSLLMPLSEVLGISVTELLCGEKVESSMDKKEVEQLVRQSLSLSMKSKCRKWIILFTLALIIFIVEMLIEFSLKIPFTLIINHEGFVAGLMLLLCGVSCFVGKDYLPYYYDENKIHYVNQGIFRFNIIGLSFNNNNWPHIYRYMNISLLLYAIFLPLIAMVIRMMMGNAYYMEIHDLLSVGAIVLIFIGAFIIGKKYE